MGLADACAPFGFDFVESALRSKASSAHFPIPRTRANRSRLIGGLGQCPSLKSNSAPSAFSAGDDFTSAPLRLCFSALDNNLPCTRRRSPLRGSASSPVPGFEFPCTGVWVSLYGQSAYAEATADKNNFLSRVRGGKPSQVT